MLEAERKKVGRIIDESAKEHVEEQDRQLERLRRGAGDQLATAVSSSAPPTSAPESDAGVATQGSPPPAPVATADADDATAGVATADAPTE